MKRQLLLLKDVEALGKKGEIVTAKPGYIRNFLLPQRLALIATPHTLRKQEQLRKERDQQAVEDRKEAEQLAAQIATVTLETHVKVDPEGHMYGSVTAADVARLFQEQGLPVERKFIQLSRPLKETGPQKINLKLKEGVTVVCTLNIIPEGGVQPLGLEQVVAPLPTTPAPEQEPPSQS